MDLYYKNKNIKNIDGEIWTDAIFFDGRYEVSNFGRVKSLRRWIERKDTGSGYYSKEVIMSQQLTKDKRLTVVFCIDNKKYTQNVPHLIYFSFNPTHSLKKKECIMHKNKLGMDNRLSNLVIETVTNSHKVNFKKNLLPHLAVNNKIKAEKYKLTETRICKHCGKEKPIKKFQPKSFRCLDCKTLMSTAYKKRHHLI